MRSAVEGGVLLTIVALRFECGVPVLERLIAKHGWERPVQRSAKGERKGPPPPKPKLSAPPLSFHRPPSVNGKNGFRAGRPPKQPANWWRDPNDLCGGRRLEGAEFKARKAELEARDRAERARVQA